MMNETSRNCVRCGDVVYEDDLCKNCLGIAPIPVKLVTRLLEQEYSGQVRIRRVQTTHRVDFELPDGKVVQTVFGYRGVDLLGIKTLLWGELFDAD